MTPVNKEIAVWLKGLGFDEPCYDYYNDEGICCYSQNYEYNDNRSDTLSAPFVSQALTWLADVKKVRFDIEYMDNDYLTSSLKWQGSVYCLSGSYHSEPLPSYDDTQTALLELIYNNRQQLGL
jgi:hypothetical protein